MKHLHIANTFFEWELTEKEVPDLLKAFEQHPVFLQLQFLPFLYGGKEDAVGISHLPPQDYWKYFSTIGINPPEPFVLSTKKTFPFENIESWGASRSIDAWSAQRGIDYPKPPWEIVKKVNSKEFSFLNSPRLPFAALLHNELEAQEWLKNQIGPRVLKTCFGMSGRGHLLITDETIQSEKISLFIKRAEKNHLPVIAEPWVKRVMDFSTQWQIEKSKEIYYFGATCCENDARGTYRSNQVGPESQIFKERLDFLETHKTYAIDLLSRIAELGYFGNVGFDAMLYEQEGKTLLHPIVEINARKTMGWVALMLQRLYFPDRLITMKYEAKSENKQGLLPEFLELKGKCLHFRKQLYLEL